MANHCVYEECPDCGAEWCTRGCGYYEKCTCTPEVRKAREEKRLAEVRKAEQKLAESMPEGWF